MEIHAILRDLVIRPITYMLEGFRGFLYRSWDTCGTLAGLFCPYFGHVLALSRSIGLSGDILKSIWKWGLGLDSEGLYRTGGCRHKNSL